MIDKQLVLPIYNEITVDLFCGGGGASAGIELAIERPIDVAINHDAEAISMHAMNHPQAIHHRSDVFEVDPVEATQGRPVGLMWASPDCKHFSKAKGGKPVDKKIRSLAWVVVKWAKAVRPRIIFIENVEEFKTWGPIGQDNMPDQKRKGETFLKWLDELIKLGYRVEWRELRACDYGAPTSRKRLFIIARCDNEPIVWPEPTHGDPKNPETKKKKLKKWRTAAECIDWSISCPSIFDRKKPLSENTMRRIAKGIMKFVVNNPEPFIVQVNHSGEGFRGQNLDEPMPTLTAKHGFGVVTPIITSIANWSSESLNSANKPLTTVTANPKGGHHALISPTLIQVGYGEAEGQAPRVPGLNKPLGTITAGGGKHALVTAFISRQYGQSIGTATDNPLATITQIDHSNLVTAFLAKHYTGIVGTELEKPLGTVTTVDHHSLVTSHITKLRGQNIGHSVEDPLHTISAQGTHFGEIRALLIKYYGNEKDGVNLKEPLHTIPTKDRFGLIIVYIHGEPYIITDIGMRMLQPHELYAAQGFPKDYIFDKGSDGKNLTKTAQVRMCGNSVCPPVAKAIVEANYRFVEDLAVA